MADVTGSAEGYDLEILVEPNVAAHTFDASSERYVIDSESLARTSEIIDATGLRGTRTKHYGRVTSGNYAVGGTITMRPGQTQIANWLPRILYGTREAGVMEADQYPVADGLPDASVFGILIDKVGDIHEFTDCVVNRCTFSASAGEALVMSLDIIGKTEAHSSWPVSPPPAFTYAENSLPILMSDGTLTIGSNTYLFENFECVIDNHVEAQFRNSQTAVSLVPQDRTVTLSVTLDYSTGVATDLYTDDSPDTTNNYAGETVHTANIAFVPVASKNFTFYFPKLIAPKETPPVTGKGAVMYPITFTAYGDDYADETDSEIYIENDVT